MTKPDLEPLPGDIERLLDAERSRPNPTPAFTTRLTERLAADVLDGAVLGDTAVPAPTSPPPPTSVGLAGRVTKVMSLLLVGAVGGAGVHAVLREPAPLAVVAPTSDTPRPIATSKAMATPPGAPTILAPSVAPAVTPPVPRSPVRPGAHLRWALRADEGSSASTYAAREAPLTRDQKLAAERALIERARSALARGEPDDAMEAIARHEREFSGGQLVEERRALEVLVLVARRETERALARATEFRQAYPASMLLRTIDQAVKQARDQAGAGREEPR